MARGSSLLAQRGRIVDQKIYDDIAGGGLKQNTHGGSGMNATMSGHRRNGGEAHNHTAARRG